jgi:hypothetical protein
MYNSRDHDNRLRYELHNGRINHIFHTARKIGDDQHTICEVNQSRVELL